MFAAFRFANWWKCLRAARLEGMEAPHPFPHTPCPMYLAHLAVPELYPFIINWKYNQFCQDYEKGRMK